MSRTALGKIADIQAGPFGTQLHADEYVSEGIPMLNAKNIGSGVVIPDALAFVSEETCNRLSRYILKKGDIIFGRAGTIDRHTYIDDDYAGSFQGTNAIRVRCRNTRIARYISYYLWLPAIIKQISDTAGKTTIKYLNTDLLKNIEVTLPSENDARAISRVLIILDRKISLNNAINAELECAARTLYDYWFTQFDFPDINGKPYKSSGGEIVWSEELKREIPKGWEVSRLCEELTFKRGVEPGSDAYSDEFSDTHTVPFIRVRDLGDKPAVYIQLENTNGYLCEPSDVLVAFDGSVGKMSIGMRGCCSSGIRNIKPKKDKFSQAFIYLYFSSQEAQSTIAKYAVGSNILHAASSIEHFLFAYDEKTVNDFIRRIEPMYRQIVANLQQNNKLTELRDFLLPLLMNSQVRIAVAAKSAVEPTVEKKTQSNVIKEPSKRDTVFKRLVLSAYILDNICDEPTSGRVKFEKLLYLSEYCAQLPLHSEFKRAPAGPYDSKSLHSIESQLSKNKWFKCQKVSSESRAYTRLAQSNEYRQYINTNLSDEQKRAIDRLIAMFKTSRTIQCEIVATLYGAWNDFLLEGVQPTDDQIVNEVLTNWHKKKERISRDRWLKALQWMRSEELIPVGYGASTKGGINA